MFERRTVNKPFEGKIEPFRIIGNVYFVGTFQASAHLIDTGEGLILIDTGYSNTLYLVLHSINKLGFKVEDIKYLLHTHYHGDHTEATEALKDLSGATTAISETDAVFAEQDNLFKADMVLKDGDILSLGNTNIRCVLTPGHTKGTMSFFFDTVDNGTVYRVGTFGGAGANTLVPTHPSFYEGNRQDYLNSINLLFNEDVDVFIGNHCWNNDTFNKGKHLLETGENLFIDKNLWREFLLFCKKRCLDLK